MRLWSLKFSYLDSKGLVALWRESLLAKAVLESRTSGYKNHPQLIRFRNQRDPIKAINTYLFYIFRESERRGFNFSTDKIDIYKVDLSLKIPVTEGQLKYEFLLLKHKLSKRAIYEYQKLENLENIEPNELFIVVPGDVEPWEKVKNFIS
ncbi:MAG: pyrimidine dimer DNA glycosylase/endonuclease V [Thermoplasmata archaeon]